MSAPCFELQAIGAHIEANG